MCSLFTSFEVAATWLQVGRAAGEHHELGDNGAGEMSRARVMVGACHECNRRNWPGTK